MVGSYGVIPQDIRWTIVCCDHRIQTAVAIEIADSQSAPHPGLIKNAATIFRDIDEALTGVPCQQHGLTIAKIGKSQLDVIKVVALSNQ